MKKEQSAAEKLSATKPWRRSVNGAPRVRGKAVWSCRCKAVRESLRLSLRDVANANDLSTTGLWQIEFGRDPMLTTARKLAAFFGVSVEELWPELVEKT